MPERVVVVSGKLDNRQDREEHALLVDWFKEPHGLLRPADDSPYAASGFGAVTVDDPPADVASASYVKETPVAYDVAPDDEIEDEAPGRYRSAPAAQNIYRVSPSPPPLTAPSSIARAASPNGNGYGGQLHVMPPPPEEPPSSPSTLYITLRRTGNNTEDFERLAQLHLLLKDQTGPDHFVVVLESADRKRIELTFPNESTRYTPGLQERVATLVGKDNIRVVTPMA